MSDSRPSPDPRNPENSLHSDPEKAARLLASALDPSPATAPATIWDPPPVEEVAEWFPGYRIEELIGRGSMGAVYKALQQRLERQVAIKLLPPEVAAREGMAARFEQEARAMAKLSHPNIVALHDYGRTVEGHLYIVMEYVDGADLSRMIHAEKGGVDVSQALEVVGQVCDALQYAHGRGFVHRDIKPGNVLVDTEGRVKIADFGLAKLLGSHCQNAEAEADPLTMTGAAVGTPDYTAPEQLRGEIIDHRADIYSLGVMFYEMLTGDLPRGAWRKPSRLVPDASPGLDEVVRRAMQAEPDKRYQQASDVKQAVEGASASTSPAPAVAPKPRKRLLGGFMICLLGVLLGAALVEWKNRRATAVVPAPAAPAIIPLPEPSERALEEMNQLIRELADEQEYLVRHHKVINATRYGSGPEQERRQAYLGGLRAKLKTATASGFPAQHSLASEADKRLGLLEESHEAALLPEVPAEECLNPEWRTASAYPDLFTGEELIPGIRPAVWSENGIVWFYYVEPIAESVPPANKEGDLQDFPEFWPIDAPTPRPTLPLSRPNTQAEADWIMQQFPEETSADSPGLLLSEFDPGGDPQLSWKYWSRHNDDLIPWATGHPIASPSGSVRGQLVLRQGVCSVVFDNEPRPRLCGGGHVEAAGWAVHLFMWSSMSHTGSTLAGTASVTDFKVPAMMKNIQSKFGDNCARECVAYVPSAAKSNAPWLPWQRDVYNLRLVQEMRAGTNTGGSIPFHGLSDSHVLVTSFLCSRELAEKIAAHHGARLPVPTGQERLDALAQLLPDGLMAHCADLPAEEIDLMKFWQGSRVAGREAKAGEAREIPAAQSPSIIRHGETGLLMPVPARALLVLEWPNSN